MSCAPDRAVLCYAVTSLLDEGEPDGIVAAYDLLLGEQRKDDAALRAELSPRGHVGPRTPPLFIWHTTDDQTVPYAHSLHMFTAAKAAGVAAELHLYAAEGQAGRHAQGLAVENPALRGWSLSSERSIGYELGAGGGS